MPNEIVRALAWGGQARIFAAVTTELVQTIQQRHQTSITATAAIGRTATAAAMMGFMLKGPESLTVKLKGDGPAGAIIVEANPQGEIRATMDEPSAEVPPRTDGKLDVAALVGTEGLLNITKDLRLKDPYIGSVPLVSGEIGDDFTYYFTVSEQTPSAVGLGVLIQPTEQGAEVIAAGGFIIQLLPGMREEAIAEIEENINQLPPLSHLIREGITAEELVLRLVPKAKIRAKIEPRFQCKCSKDRVEQSLISIGAVDLQQIIDEDGQAEVVCHFCREAYQFNKRELEAILADCNA